MTGSTWSIERFGEVPQRAPAQKLPRTAATLLIAAIFLVCAIHVTPFPDLRSVKNIELAGDGNLLTQVAFALLFLAAAWQLKVVGLRHLAPLATPWLTALAAWIAFTLVLSPVPLTSIRRFVLTAICIALSATLLLVARSIRHLARTLAAVSAAILLLSYLSVFLAPDFATHTSLDLREPDLAGDWRGPFSHKNEAGAVMALFIFIGILAANVGERVLGWMVIGGAAAFMVFTHSKTASAVAPLAIAAVALARFGGHRLSAALLTVPIAVVGSASVGSHYYRPIKDWLDSLGVDTTFTGRTQIWDFAADHIAQRPWIGWGYGAFWRTEQTQQAYSGSEHWFAQADQAHNAYIDIALFMGLPGLVLSVVALAIMPLRDVRRTPRHERFDALSSFFLMNWVFALCTGFFESVLFEGNSAVFLMFMLAVFGLRFRTVAPAIVR